MSSSNAEKLRLYEEQLATVDAALAQDPSNDEWLRLKADLVEVIRLTQQLSEVKSEAAAAAEASAAGAAAAAVAATELKSYGVGEKCQAIFEMDGQWYNAKVVALSEDGYFVTYLGYGNTAQVDFAEVRSYVRPDTSEWRPGAEVQAIAAADQRWYPAKLLSVGPTSARLRFHGEAEAVEVEIDNVRSAQSAAAGAGTAGGKRDAAGTSSSATTAGAGGETNDQSAAPKPLPRGTEVLPTDSEEEAARKKKKLNMVKRQEKREREERHGDERRSSWQSFSTKNRKVQRAKNGHDPNWDPTRDHGEVAARVAIDKFHSLASREHR